MVTDTRYKLKNKGFGVWMVITKDQSFLVYQKPGSTGEWTTQGYNGVSSRTLRGLAKKLARGDASK